MRQGECHAEVARLRARIDSLETALLRAGGSLIFIRGVITAEGEPCLNFSGTIKRLRKG